MAIREHGIYYWDGVDGLLIPVHIGSEPLDPAISPKGFISAIYLREEHEVSARRSCYLGTGLSGVEFLGSYSNLSLAVTCESVSDRSGNLAQRFDLPVQAEGGGGRLSIGCINGLPHIPEVRYLPREAVISYDITSFLATSSHLGRLCCRYFLSLLGLCKLDSNKVWF